MGSFNKQVQILTNLFNSLELYTIQAITKDDFLYKHFGETENEFVSESYLKERICSKRVRRATAFSLSRKEILILIKEALLEYTPDIAGWLLDYADGQPYEVYYDSDKPLGYGFETGMNWSKGPVQCSSFKIVLVKDERKVNGFYIKTIYPFATDKDKENLNRAWLGSIFLCE